MNKSQIIQEISNQLAQLAVTDATIIQEPYRSDLYEVFIPAASQGFVFDYGSNNMHADALIQDLIDAGVPMSDNLESIRSMWGEWSFCYQKRSGEAGFDGKVMAYFVSKNDDGKLAYVSDGYPRAVRISLLGLKPLTAASGTLHSPQHAFPKNQPIANLYFYNGTLFGS
jgi:hypothetical protein